MATRYAVGNGNWSSAATWDNGASLGIPTTGDDVYANGFTISVDQSFNVATLRTTSLAAESTRLNPIMTTNTAPSGVASASSNSGSAFQAFDANINNFWQASSAVPQWVQYQFTSSIIIRSYSIYYNSAISGRPTSFNLQGSNDGVAFVTLDTRTGFVFTNNAYNTLTITNPTTAYSYYRLNVTATDTGNPVVVELTFNEAGASVAAGGSFNFNTAGVTGTVTSSSPLFPGATNLVQITATTGTVTLSLGGNVAPRNVTSDVLILHSGNCNFNVTGTNFNGATSQNNTSCINKTSSGLITITGNLNGGNAGGFITNQAFASTNGNTIVIGNVVGGIGTGGSHRAINQSAGTLTVTGNATGGQGAGSNQGILFSGTSLTVTGTITGGTAASAIVTSAPINNINGNVTAGTVQAIGSTDANQISVTGTVTASSASAAITMTNANGQVYLNGNMVNNNGKMAIYAPIVWLDKNNTTSAAFFTSGGVARTLYSADTAPNTPAANNVRSGTIYGAGNSLTGTLVIPVAANVRNGVTYDNGTVGTALFTTSQFITELSSSTTPVAVRMQNLCTPMILGELMEAFKK